MHAPPKYQFREIKRSWHVYYYLYRRISQTHLHTLTKLDWGEMGSQIKERKASGALSGGTPKTKSSDNGIPINHCHVTCIVLFLSCSSLAPPGQDKLQAAATPALRIGPPGAVQLV